MDHFVICVSLQTSYGKILYCSNAMLYCEFQSYFLLCTYWFCETEVVTLLFQAPVVFPQQGKLLIKAASWCDKDRMKQCS